MLHTTARSYDYIRVSLIESPRTLYYRERHQPHTYCRHRSMPELLRDAYNIFVIGAITLVLYAIIITYH
jgi:hypothetical protein